MPTHEIDEYTGLGDSDGFTNRWIGLAVIDKMLPRTDGFVDWCVAFEEVDGVRFASASVRRVGNLENARLFARDWSAFIASGHTLKPVIGQCPGDWKKLVRYLISQLLNRYGAVNV